jgi:hypothetical protein
MPVTIGNLTTEVVAEADEQAAADAGSGDTPDQRQTVRAELAALARQAMRTRAEGFDD